MDVAEIPSPPQDHGTHEVSSGFPLFEEILCLPKANLSVTTNEQSIHHKHSLQGKHRSPNCAKHRTTHPKFHVPKEILSILFTLR